MGKTPDGTARNKSCARAPHSSSSRCGDVIIDERTRLSTAEIICVPTKTKVDFTAFSNSLSYDAGSGESSVNLSDNCAALSMFGRIVGHLLTRKSEDINCATLDLYPHLFKQPMLSKNAIIIDWPPFEKTCRLFKLTKRSDGICLCLIN